METVIVNGYEVVLQYDRDDAIYVATATALPGCMAHGGTQQEAVAEVTTAIQLHVDTAKKLGRKAAAPMKVYKDKICS